MTSNSRMAGMIPAKGVPLDVLHGHEEKGVAGEDEHPVRQPRSDQKRRKPRIGLPQGKAPGSDPLLDSRGGLPQALHVDPIEIGRLAVVFRVVRATWVRAKGVADTTPSTCRIESRTGRQSSILRDPPEYSRTRTWGFTSRIFSWKSSLAPVMTAMTTMRAVTPTVTPPRETQVMKERNRPPLRGARYRRATSQASFIWILVGARSPYSSVLRTGKRITSRMEA